LAVARHLIGFMPIDLLFWFWVAPKNLLSQATRRALNFDGLPE
jgi:hypothetical protein